MQSNDARMLLQCAVPTALAGAVAAAVSTVLAGGKGAVGAAAGAAVVILFMGIGLVVLQGTAKSLPHLFQAMGLLLYTTQILLLAVVLMIFKDTTLFNTKAFGFSLLAAALVWVAAQARSHMKAKILYVDPASSDHVGGDTKTVAAGRTTS
jgi:ATP synthase protein I